MTKNYYSSNEITTSGHTVLNNHILNFKMDAVASVSGSKVITGYSRVGNVLLPASFQCRFAFYKETIVKITTTCVHV